MSMMVQPHRFGGGGGSPDPAPTFVGSARIDNTGAGSVAYPVGYANGDVAIFAVETASQEMPTPTGYTLVDHDSFTTATRLTVFWKLLDGTEGTFSYGDSGDHQIGELYIFRGCVLPGGSPVNAYGKANGNGVSPTIPGFTTTEHNCLVLGIVVEDNFGSLPNTFVNADLTDITLLDGFGSSSGNNGAINGVYGLKATAGSVGAMGFQRGSGASWAGFQIAIR